MAPTPSQRAGAEARKAEGNTLFNKGKFTAAIDAYTEAIALDPTLAVAYVNRAMAHKKCGTWAAVTEDARSALALDRELFKAHYLLGVALREGGGGARGSAAELEGAARHLTRALEAAREKGDSIKDEIWRELARTKYAAWQAAAAARRLEHDALKQRLRALLEASGAAQPLARASAQRATAAQSRASEGKEEVDAEWARWEVLFDEAGASYTRAEVPNALTCPLTFELLREPVVTPAGHSYERAALLEHLSKVGRFDPINRDVAVREADVLPNLRLRAAVNNYLDEHGWAWAEAL